MHESVTRSGLCKTGWVDEQEISLYDMILYDMIYDIYDMILYDMIYIYDVIYDIRYDI